MHAFHPRSIHHTTGVVVAVSSCPVVGTTKTGCYTSRRQTTRARAHDPAECPQVCPSAQPAQTETYHLVPRLFPCGNPKVLTRTCAHPLRKYLSTKALPYPQRR